MNSPADIWGLTASILGHRAATLPILSEAAAARPRALVLQATLEGLAATEGDFARAVEANYRLPPTSGVLIRRIMLLHGAQRHLECVDVLACEHANLDSEDRRYATALAMATISADRMLRTELANRWSSELKTRDGWHAHAALLQYFRSVEQNVLGRDEALAELERDYERLGRPSSMELQLFYELDASKADHCTKILQLGDRISQTRLLDFDACLHYAQSLATLGSWEDLLPFIEEKSRQFYPNDRLQAVRALALDKLGLTADAHAVLESLVAKPEPDSVAVNTYIAVNSRLGFNHDAVVCLERVFSKASTREVRIRCLHALFNLEYLRDPTSHRLFEIVLRLSVIVDKNAEAEEGLFLVLTICATMTRNFANDDPDIAAFRERLKIFTVRFPDSKVLKQGALPENASADELMRFIRDMTGMTEEKLRLRTRNRNLVERGRLPFPYAWRPQYVLDGIPDLPTLWEIGKRSKSDECHLQLSMVPADWEQDIELSQLSDSVPLIDLVALLVLHDFGLIDALFQVFRRIAVSKGTLHCLQQFLAPMSVSPFRDKCANLQGELERHFREIEQPGLPLDCDDAEEREGGQLKMPHEDLLVIARRGNYRLYSDAVFFRAAAELPESAPKAMCTLDLLVALDELGHRSPHYIAQCFAKLCEWRVFARIPIRYQISVLPQSLLTASTISAKVDALRGDEHASRMFDALWTIEKPFKELQIHGAAVLHSLILDKKNNVDSVAALAAWWVMKVKLHRDAPEHTFLPAFLIVHAFVSLPLHDEEICRRIWNVHQAIVEHEYGEKMDDSTYRSSIEMLARVAAGLDLELCRSGAGAIGGGFYKALTRGTTDFDTFDAAYKKRMGREY